MSSGFPDWQGIQQWFGATVFQGTNQTLNGGSQASGNLQLASWASIVVWCKAQVAPVTITVVQKVTDGPSALQSSTTIVCAAGVTIAQSVVLSGDLVTVTVTGGGAGCIADWAILPSNSTTITSVASTATITRVTALPASPFDTQVVSYAPDAVTYPGVEWLCIYNSTTGYWDVIGGSPLIKDVGNVTSEGTASVVYVALATAGPTIVLPNAGDYDITQQTNAFANGTGQDLYMSYDIGGTGAVDADATSFYEPAAANIFGYTARTRRKTGLGAVTLTSKYRISGGGLTGTWQKRTMIAMPVRIQ